MMKNVSSPFCLRCVKLVTAKAAPIARLGMPENWRHPPSPTTRVKHLSDTRPLPNAESAEKNVVEPPHNTRVSEINAPKNKRAANGNQSSEKTNPFDDTLKRKTQ